MSDEVENEEHLSEVLRQWMLEYDRITMEANCWRIRSEQTAELGRAAKRLLDQLSELDVSPETERAMTNLRNVLAGVQATLPGDR